MGNPNPFGDFEDDFKKTEKAEAAASPGRIPTGTYKFVLTSQENKEGVLSDHEVFTTPSGTKAFKLYCEVLEPEEMPNPKTGEPHITKGAVLEHPFWITQKNLPYVKRDLSTILERDLESLGEVTSITWAGRTFEGVVKDEEYNGFMRSKIAFFNPWAPPAEDAKEEQPPKKEEPPKKTQQPPAKGAAKPTQPVKGGRPNASF